MTLLDNGALPDIIFLDINMPILNGYETLAEIRRNAKLVIAMASGPLHCRKPLAQSKFPEKFVYLDYVSGKGLYKY